MRHAKAAKLGARCVGLMLLAGLALGLPISARADEVGERKLRILLLGPDRTPERALLEQATPDAKAALMRMAIDGGAHPFMRDRALVALGAFGGDDVEALFARVLDAPSTHEITRHKVLLAYARTFGVRALPMLQRGLEDPRPAIRLTAVEALGDLESPEARQALRAASAKPQSVAVQRALFRALKR